MPTTLLLSPLSFRPSYGPVTTILRELFFLFFFLAIHTVSLGYLATTRNKGRFVVRPPTHLQKSHSNGVNKSHGQFQQKTCTLDVQNLKNGLKKIFIIGHRRKSPFCTFSCINLGFGRPWDMLQKNFLIAIFIMLQKNAFGQKKF